MLVVIADNKYYGCYTNEDISYEEADYSSFLISAIEGSEYSTSHPSRFSPGKGRQHPLERRLHGRKSQSKILVKIVLSCLSQGSTSRNTGSLVLYTCGCSRESKEKNPSQCHTYSRLGKHSHSLTSREAFKVWC